MPLKSIADDGPTYKAPLFKLSRFITPNRFRKHERKAFSAPDSDDVQRSIGQRQYEYIGWPRSNSVRVCSRWFETLAPSEAYLLNAANVEARISFAKTAVHEAALGSKLTNVENASCLAPREPGTLASPWA